MKNNELTESIIKILKEKTQLTPQEIAYQVRGSLSLIQVHGVLSSMRESGVIREVIYDRIRYYSLITTTHVDRPESTRNLSKYTFNGISKLSKGRLALAIVSKYVKDTNPSLKQLKTEFPDDIVKPYGVIQSEAIALELSPDPKRKRYFLNDEDIIILKKGNIKKICVTNQWTSDRFLKLLKLAEDKLSYQITRYD